MKKKSPLSVGSVVLIRTVTLYYTGKIIGLTDQEVVLSEAAWIPDTGRFSDALSKGTLTEVEPYPEEGIVSINRGAIIDVSFWGHALPRDVK